MKLQQHLLFLISLATAAQALNNMDRRKMTDELYDRNNALGQYEGLRVNTRESLISALTTRELVEELETRITSGNTSPVISEGSVFIPTGNRSPTPNSPSTLSEGGPPSPKLADKSVVSNNPGNDSTAPLVAPSTSKTDNISAAKRPKLSLKIGGGGSTTPHDTKTPANGPSKDGH